MKNALISIIVAFVTTVVVGLVGGHQSVPLGGRTTFDTIKGSGLVVGTTTNSTNLSFLASGSCTLGTQGPSSIDASQAATSTKVYDCAVAGTNAADIVFASIATSTVAGPGGWDVAFSKASTTPGFIEVGVTNNTGASVVPSTQSVGSSTSYVILRSQTSDQGL